MAADTALVCTKEPFREPNVPRKMCAEAPAAGSALVRLQLAAADVAPRRAVRRYSLASCRRTRSFPTASSTCTSASFTRCAPGAATTHKRLATSVAAHAARLRCARPCRTRVPAATAVCARQVEDKGKQVAGDAAADQRMARKPAADGVLDPRLVPVPRLSAPLAAAALLGDAEERQAALARAGRQQPLQHVRDVQPEAERVHGPLWCGARA